MPEAVLLRQHGSWERIRRAPRPQLDGGDAHRAMLPDHTRYPPQGRAARVRCTTKSIAKKSITGSLPPAVPLAITPTFNPWTHTSDDSYIYQLSLVLATATVSLWKYPFSPRLYPFRHVAIWCAPDWFKIVTGWRQFQVVFQVVVVVARRKYYVRRQIDQRARPAQT